MAKKKLRTISCKICQHKDCDKLNRDMVLHNMSAPELEKKYGFLTRTISVHRSHITQKLALAHERKQRNDADQLYEDVQKLWSESCDFLETSKDAVKTQAVTEWVEEDIMVNGLPLYIEGEKQTKMVQKTVYKEYRDLGATATALRVSHENRRLFGDVTGAIHPPQEKGGSGVVLHVIIPGYPTSKSPQVEDTKALEASYSESDD